MSWIYWLFGITTRLWLHDTVAISFMFNIEGYFIYLCILYLWIEASIVIVHRLIKMTLPRRIVGGGVIAHMDLEKMSFLNILFVRCWQKLSVLTFMNHSFKEKKDNTVGTELVNDDVVDSVNITFTDENRILDNSYQMQIFRFRLWRFYFV